MRSDGGLYRADARAEGSVMKTDDEYPRWLAGHRIDGRIYDFPHVCPGAGCAIAGWLFRKNERIVYENLQQKTKAS